MKVVINRCHGGFSLSHEGIMRYAEIAGIELYPYIDEWVRERKGDDYTVEDALAGGDRLFSGISYSRVPEETYFAGTDEQRNEWYFYSRDIGRDDPSLVQVVEEMGEKADGACAHLSVVKIPDGVDYVIEEYDGLEWVAECHRTWS